MILFQFGLLFLILQGPSHWPLFMGSTLNSGDLSLAMIQEKLIGVGSNPMLAVYGSTGVKKTFEVATEMANKMTNAMMR